jgi:cell division protein ZapA
MSQEPIPVTVRILDKEFRIACEAHEQEALIESARMLDHRMREIRQAGRVVGTDRIAIIAALNIAHELIELRHAQGKLQSDAAQRLGALQVRIAEALAS